MSYIIAEAGVNYDGDFEKAKRLIEAALIAGTNAIKFQIFWDIGDKLKKYELSKEQWVELQQYAESFGFDFLATPHWGSPLTFYKDEDYGVIDFVDTLVKKHKIASPYLVNEKYCKYIASKGKPILLSTGSIVNKNAMATDEEIKTALGWLKDADVTLLHCISQYPAKPNYKRVKTLRKFKKPVGVSDHSLEKMLINWPVIEKHFKLDDCCIDANVSLNPNDFREMVRNVRNYQSIFGKLS